MRQVTHALLTRPPLTFKSLGFIKSPFDLHVLSTPPAFILSQDQTLMFKSSSCQKLSGITVFLGGFFRTFILPNPVLNLFLWNLQMSCFCSTHFLEFFRVALLFICQGTSKAGLCAKGIFGSMLTINSFCAKDYGATAHNERVSRELSLRLRCHSTPNGEGGIWTLAPLLTTCTLSRGVPSASLGTSPQIARIIIPYDVVRRCYPQQQYWL